MSYDDDLISPDWEKPLRDVMPDKCKDVIDNKPDNTRVGKNGELGWFILKDSKVIWCEKTPKPKKKDIHDDESCPECGEECYHIPPFKQCKNCKSVFKDEVRID